MFAKMSPNMVEGVKFWRKKKSK